MNPFFRKITIQILNENESVLNSIDTNSSDLRNFSALQNLIKSHINTTNKKIEYFCTDYLGRLKPIQNSIDFFRNLGANLYKIKLSPLITSNNTKEEISLNLFDISQKFTNETANNIKDSLKCWICLKDSLIEKPFFCLNPDCFKGVHEQCLKSNGHRGTIRCICGKIYNVDMFKPNKLVNDLSKFAINVEKIRKDESNKIKNLENKVKEYESIPQKCSKHPNDFIIHYCYDCDKAFCGTCFITNELNEHKNHRLINYEKYSEINQFIKDVESQTDNVNKELFVFISSIDTLEKSRDEYLKELQIIIDNVKNKFDKLIKELKEKKEAIVNKNNEISNLKEKAKNFLDSLDRNKYNELKNINEIKNQLNFNTNISNNTNNIIEEINKNINDIKNLNNNSNKNLNNLKNLLKNKYLFDPLIFVDELGRRYEGDRKNNLKEGKGILYFQNGDKYEGEFKNDKMDGKGVLYYANGEKFKGKFKEDKKIGKGKYFFKDGTTAEEIYDNGILIGRNLDLNFLPEDEQLSLNN